MQRRARRIEVGKPLHSPFRWRALCAAGVVGVSPLACAQDVGATQGLTFTGDVGLNYVETRRDTAVTHDVAQQLRPGVQYVLRQGRTQGSLAYGLDMIRHTDSEQGSELRHSLNATLSSQPVENWLYVDASASVMRRAISAFGQQSAPGSLQKNDNYEDVGQLSLRPSIRGSFGGLVGYDVRAHAGAVNQRHSKVGDSTEYGGSQSLYWQGRGVFGAGLTTTQQRSDFRTGRKTTNDRIIADLSWNPDVDWRVSARGGQEETNVGQIEKKRFGNWGAGVRWTPSPRTTANIDADHRYFGDSWNIALEHRFPQSVLRFSSVRDANQNTGANTGATITLYDLYFFQFESLVPDPVMRDLFVRAFLRNLGLDPAMTLPGGFASNAVTVQRRSELGWTFTGPRVTLGLMAYTSRSSTLDTLAPARTDDAINQRSYSASLSYRLTPTASVSFSGSRLMTSGSAREPANGMKSVSAGLTETLGPRTTATLNARYSVFDGPDAYRETGLGAFLNHRF